MGQDPTWYGGRPLPSGHCVRWGPPKKGHSPQFSAHVYCGHGRPSQLLLGSCFRIISSIADRKNRNDPLLAGKHTQLMTEKSGGLEKQTLRPNNRDDVDATTVNRDDYCCCSRVNDQH